MSECCGATTISTDPEHRWGSIGFSMAGCETRVFRVADSGSGSKLTESKLSRTGGHLTEEEQGEICFRCIFVQFHKPSTPFKFKGLTCCRGRHIMMGYLCNPLLGKEHEAEMLKKNQVRCARKHRPVFRAIFAWHNERPFAPRRKRSTLKDGCTPVTRRHVTPPTCAAHALPTSPRVSSKPPPISQHLARCDPAFRFKITGRYKELIIGAGGENVAPVPIEAGLKRAHGAIRFSRAIFPPTFATRLVLCHSSLQACSNCVMVGDKRKFNVVLVTLKAVGATGERPGESN